MKKYDGLYEFNATGIELFQRVFTGEIDDVVIDAHDQELAHKLPGSKEIQVVDYATAKDLAAAVLESLGQNDLFELVPRTGLWAWVTFVLRERLFKRDASGRWKVGEIHRWYPSPPDDWQKAQRHLVRMPVVLLATFGNGADHLLCNAPSILPEIREQLTSQQDMFDPEFQSVARALYFDDTRKSLKRGAGGKGAGSPRRLAKVRQQLDVTWELQYLGFDRIIETLPREFNRFKPASVQSS